MLRELIQQPGIIASPSLYDPLMARLAERSGLPCVSVGGYAMGAHTAITEPLLSLTECVAIARRIAAAVRIPVVVDAATGWGEPIHVMRTVREFEAAGVAAIHLEDQRFPKRAHYHKGVEHVVPVEEMLVTIKSAIAARQNPDFVIIARTDAMSTDGFEEGMRRARLFAEAGADMIMLFPNNAEEARRAPQEISTPLVYVNSEGTRFGRPIFSLQELEAMGYKMAYDSIGVTNVAFRAVHELFANLMKTGRTGLDQEAMIANRKLIETTIGLEEYYQIEAETVEK